MIRCRLGGLPPKQAGQRVSVSLVRTSTGRQCRVPQALHTWLPSRHSWLVSRWLVPTGSLMASAWTSHTSVHRPQPVQRVLSNANRPRSPVFELVMLKARLGHKWRQVMHQLHF
jgi:hypothetical protein